MVLVVGSGAARGVAVRLDESATVRFPTDEEIAQRACSSGVDSYRLDVTDAKRLQPVAEGVDVAVVAERLDRRTLLIAQLLRPAVASTR